MVGFEPMPLKWLEPKSSTLDYWPLLFPLFCPSVFKIPEHKIQDFLPFQVPQPRAQEQSPGTNIDLMYK